MAATRSLRCLRIERGAIFLGLLGALPLALAADHGGSLRNQNPLLQIFGLPPFQSAKIADAESNNYNLSFDVVNHAESGSNSLESIAMDGESYFLTLSLRRGFSERLELGIDVPFVAHAGGFLDNVIENWHDLLGLSNSKRRGADDQLGFLYSKEGQTLYELNSTTRSIGDVQLTAAIPLRKGDVADPLSVSLRSSVKLPTGSASELSGSGAVDFSLGIYASNQYSLWQRGLDISGFAGILLLGDGDILTDLQRSSVPYGGVAASLWLADRFAVATQLQVEGPYYDSDLEELGGASAQLAVGFDYRLPRGGALLHFSITEDIASGTTTTPDFGVHLSISKAGR